jgi:hypothetical protein
MTRLVFGEADPSLFTSPESAEEQTFHPTALRLDLGTVYLARLPRKRCDGCGLRRVRFQLRSQLAPRSLALCATCAGVR